jgi:hypothetical protein
MRYTILLLSFVYGHHSAFVDPGTLHSYSTSTQELFGTNQKFRSMVCVPSKGSRKRIRTADDSSDSDEMEDYHLTMNWKNFTLISPSIYFVDSTTSSHGAHEPLHSLQVRMKNGKHSSPLQSPSCRCLRTWSVFVSVVSAHAPCCCGC